MPPATPAPAATPRRGAPAAKPLAPAPAAGDAGKRAAPAVAAGARAPPRHARIDQDIQGLKKDVVDLNRDLFVLEEELLFPANTQVAVFVSMDVGDFFLLDSVTLKIDQKEVANYLYTPREVEALAKGGVQRLYVGNLKAGQHELVAFFNGQGPHERDYRRGATAQVREGHRRQIPRAQDQRPAAPPAAGIRDQGLGIGLRIADAADALARPHGRRRAARRPTSGAGRAARTRRSFPPTRVHDLHYGDVLFYVYTDDDFEAITRLNAYEHWHLLPHHEAGAQLLLGGLYLSLGLHNEAGARFEKLLTPDIPARRAQPRLVLSGAGVVRARLSGARRARDPARCRVRCPTARCAKGTPAANMLLRQGRFDEAIELLNSWKGPADWMAYARFNLGVALVRAGPSRARRIRY